MGGSQSAAGDPLIAAAGWSSPDTPRLCPALHLHILEARQAVRKSRSECPGNQHRADVSTVVEREACHWCYEKGIMQCGIQDVRQQDC